MKNSLETKQNSSVKLGEIYQLGAHRIACGSSSDVGLLKELLGGEKIGLLLCDPPYSVDAAASKRGFKQKLGNDRDIVNDHIQTDAEYKVFSKAWLKVLVPYFAKKNSCYIFNADRMIFALREAMLEEGYKFAQLIIWVKNHAVVGRLDYLPQHELLAYGWVGTHKFMKSKDKSVLFCPKPSKSPLHPSTKPVSLLRRIVLNSSVIDDVVFDGYLGSGSTLISCEDTKRRCYGVEIDPEYITTIIKRFEKKTGVKAVKIGTYVTHKE